MQLVVGRSRNDFFFLARNWNLWGLDDIEGRAMLKVAQASHARSDFPYILYVQDAKSQSRTLRTATIKWYQVLNLDTGIAGAHKNSLCVQILQTIRLPSPVANQTLRPNVAAVQLNARYKV